MLTRSILFLDIELFLLFAVLFTPFAFSTYITNSFTIRFAQMPLHTIIEIQMGVTGVQEKRYKLMETQSTSREPDLMINSFLFTSSYCAFRCTYIVVVTFVSRLLGDLRTKS